MFSLLTFDCKVVAVVALLKHIDVHCPESCSCEKSGHTNMIGEAVCDGMCTRKTSGEEFWQHRAFSGTRQ